MANERLQAGGTPYRVKSKNTFASPKNLLARCARAAPALAPFAVWSSSSRNRSSSLSSQGSSRIRRTSIRGRGSPSGEACLLTIASSSRRSSVRL